MERELNRMLDPILIVKFNTALIVYCRSQMTRNFYVKSAGKDREFKLTRSVQAKVTNATSALLDADTYLWSFCQRLSNDMATLILMDNVHDEEEKMMRETLGSELETDMKKLLQALNVCFLVFSQKYHRKYFMGFCFQF